MSVTKTQRHAAWENSMRGEAFAKIVEQARACAAQGMTRAETAAHMGIAYNRVYVMAQRYDIKFAVRRSNRVANIKAARVRETQKHQAAIRRPAGPNYAGIKAALRW